jgi:TonB family protein
MLTTLLQTLVVVAMISLAQPARVGAQERPYTVKPGAVLDRVTGWVRPEYPKSAQDANVTGTVDVEVTLTQLGVLASVRVLSGPTELREAVERAMRNWTFRRVNDKELAVPVSTTLTFEFVAEYGGFYATLQRGPETYGKGRPLPAPAVLPPSDAPGAGPAKSEPEPTLPLVASSQPPDGRSRPPSPVATKARILNRPRPNYTEQARANHTEGTVVFGVLLLADGSVGRVQFVHGLPDGLNAKAVEAARELKFEPARDAVGKAIASWVTVAVNFSIR